MKRGRMELLHDMLLATQQKGGKIKPTHLLYRANLSHDTMKQYLHELMEKGLLQEKDEKGKKVYHLTDKGNKFLEEYKKFSQFAETFGV